MRMISLETLGMLLLFSALSACSSSDDDEQPVNYADCEVAPPEVPIEDARARLVGTWSYTNSITMCTETYNFMAPDEGAAPVGPAPFNHNEAQEDISGLYGLVEPEDGSGLRLVQQFLTDNLMPDCTGSVEDNSGTAYQSSLSFPSSTQFRITELDPPYNCKNFVRN